MCGNGQLKTDAFIKMLFFVREVTIGTAQYGDRRRYREARKLF